jgi:hypothetical protein
MTHLSLRTPLGALPFLTLNLLLAISTSLPAEDRFNSKERSLLLAAAKPSKSARSNGKTAPKAPRPAQQPQPQQQPKVEPKPEDNTYELRYKLERGDVLRYEVSHKASIRSTIDETTQSAQTRTDSVKALKVLDVLPEGDIEFNTVVENVHMVNQLPDHDATEYDSTRDKVVPPGFEDAAKAVGVPLSVMQITPQGKVLRRDVKIRNQGAENDAPIVLRLPEKRVVIGDTWDEPFDVQVKLKDNGTKMIQTRRHHKLSDVQNGVATIDVTYQVLSPIDAQIETQIVQKLMEGQVRFDLAKGHVISQEMQVDKRVIGFAGPTSTMQYIMKMEESLLPAEAKTAATKLRPEPVAKTNPKKSESSATTAKKSTSTGSSKTQTATRQRTTQPSNKSYRR